MKPPNAHLRKVVAVLRPFRPIIERPKGSEYLFYLAAVLALAWVIEILLSKKWSGVSYGLVIGASTASCAAFLLETQAKVRAALASVWARVLGKAMFGVLALLVNYLATSLAKHFVHLVVHADPKFFPEFIGIISIGIAALLFLAAIQFAVSLLGLLRLLSSYVVVMLHQTVGNFAPNAFGFFWRLVFGKRARFIAFKHSLFATVSFCGSLSLVLALAYPAILLAQHSAYTSSVLTKFLVAVEFRSGASCANLTPSSRVAYLDRGWVSVAQPTLNGFDFPLTQCAYAADPAMEGGSDKAAQSPSL